MTKVEDSHKQNANLSDVDEATVASLQVTDERIVNWIKSRRSVANLNTPAPSTQQLREAIECAMTAPDHKGLKPWRFIVTQGQARYRLGRAFLAAAQAKALREGLEINETTAKKMLNMPLRAPVIITVVTRMQYHERVPPFEQILSTGAAVQNLLLALKAQGFSTVWRTGLLCNEPAVKSYFNVSSEDYITAFVYTGSSSCDFPIRKRIDVNGFVKFES